MAQTLECALDLGGRLLALEVKVVDKVDQCSFGKVVGTGREQLGIY